jgi:hypothetical protein
MRIVPIIAMGQIGNMQNDPSKSRVEGGQCAIV